MADKEFHPLTGSAAVKILTDAGLLPPGTTRFVLDSGEPGEVVRIWWKGWADQELIELMAAHMHDSFMRQEGKS